MKKLALAFLLVFSVMFLVSGISFAQNTKVELKYGSFNPTRDLDDDEWDKGEHWELAGTYRESDMGVQVAIGRYTTELSDDYSDSVLGNIEQDDTLTVIPVTLSFLGFFDSGPLHAYGGGGVGYYFAEYESERDLIGLGSKLDDSDKDTVFGYHAMAGLTYDITESILIGVEGKLIRTEEATFDLKDNGVEAQYEAELSGNLLLVTLGFRF